MRAGEGQLRECFLEGMVLELGPEGQGGLRASSLGTPLERVAAPSCNPQLGLPCFQTATLYPGVVFGICFVLNCFIWGKHSSGAVSKGGPAMLGPTPTGHFLLFPSLF